MSNPLLAELHALLRDTDVLLACSEPDSEQLETYGQRRQAIFSRLQDKGEQSARDDAELLRKVLLRIQEQDTFLIQCLERHRDSCRTELLTLARARQTVHGRTPSCTGRLLERHI